MNPYQVLGIDENSTGEEINRAYKEKMKDYSQNPDLNSSLIDELNFAYDSLMYNSNTEFKSSSNQSIKYGDVRSKIKSKRFEDAETILDGVPIDMRDAEWHFLKGKIFHSRGWLEDAAESYAKAHSLEPDNAEFAAALEEIKSKRSGKFRSDWRQNSESGSGCANSLCSICTALTCCDCMCSLCR